ncbi:MAG: helix-turn-helix domain-containing protein [Planctomycetaceae bacterium]|nr:helix-turn-helix domain-containing protein [Planctomycetaceae bacterium]
MSLISVSRIDPGQGFLLQEAVYNECVTLLQTTDHDDTEMEKIVHPLLAMIASATDRELAKYVEFLKEENRILRARVPGKQIHTKPHERERLLKLGKSLGHAVEELLTIVSPSTFYRWMRDETGRPRSKRPKGGQRKPKEIRELVIQIARTTGFGYSRIIGELQNLGLRRISRQTVRNILKEEMTSPTFFSPQIVDVHFERT